MSSTQILIVEDEAIAAIHLQKALESLGYAVPAVVAYGEEAIKRVGEVEPDLVLMDIVLKGAMDGVQAAEQIRDRFGTPVVYITSFSDSDTLQRAKVTEPSGYIIKPFDEKALHTTIEIALYKHEIESRSRERTEELEALYSVSRILAQPWNFEEKCKGVLKALAQIARADMAIMRVMDEKENGMRLMAKVGSAAWERPESLPAERSVSGMAFLKRETVVASDYPSHPLADPSAVAQGLRSLVSVPVKADRWTLGVINLASRETDHFPPRLVSLLSGIADGLGTL